MHNKTIEIQSAAEEACSSPITVPLIGGAHSETKEVSSKSDFLASMVNGQLPSMGEHRFRLDTNYVVCQRCNGRQLKHSSKAKLEDLAMSKCWHEQWPKDEQWTGHFTHQMWRTGRKVYCSRCKAQALNKGDKYQASRALTSRCVDASTQQQLPSCFRAKTAGS